MVSAGRYLPTGRHLYGGTYDEGGKLLMKQAAFVRCSIENRF